MKESFKDAIKIATFYKPVKELVSNIHSSILNKVSEQTRTNNMGAIHLIYMDVIDVELWDPKHFNG